MLTFVIIIIVIIITKWMLLEYCWVNITSRTLYKIKIQNKIQWAHSAQLGKTFPCRHGQRHCQCRVSSRYCYCYCHFWCSVILNIISSRMMVLVTSSSWRPRDSPECLTVLLPVQLAGVLGHRRSRNLVRLSSRPVKSWEIT